MIFSSFNSKSYLNNFIVNLSKSKLINPIPTGGGPFGPQRPKTVWRFRSFMTGVTKIHDFVYFSMCLVPLELFLKKKVMKFLKIEKKIFTVLTPKPFGKKIEKIKIFCFFIKNYTIST